MIVRSLLAISDELPLSPRHEQAKLLLERARLKARSNHINEDLRCRRPKSDQRSTIKKQQVEPLTPAPEQKAVQTKEDNSAQTVSDTLLIPSQRDTSPSDQGARSRRYGCSPTRVRFEDESEKEAESRYLDRVRQRSRSGGPKSKKKVNNTDSSSSGTERNKSHRSVSMPPLQKKEVAGFSGEPTTVIKEIIVLVKKCEACGSMVREPQPMSSQSDPKNTEPHSLRTHGKKLLLAGPVALEPRLPESSGLRESPPPTLPIKSALKSSSRNRSAAGQSSVQFQITSNPGGEGGSQNSELLDPTEARGQSAVALTQGSPATSNPVPCIRPSTLRYSAALPAVELWEATPDGAGEPGSGPECRPALRGLAMSRAEDLRAELLRAEHLKAEAIWEENCDGSRKMDGRPKLFLRRFFSSIGLNSVGRLVKGGRSSSMEQLSLPSAPRVGSSASSSPTRRPQPSIRMQRTPSLQTLNTVLPLAQLRKASSVQSLERRTERSTILGEVRIPYGLAPSPDSPQIEFHRALSAEDILASRIVRPVGRVTQAFPDGTLLLELVRPPNGPFGFVISRGKGRPNTGVYVEKVGDGGVEGPYTGLLGIGDEILQVNGEAVAGLSLDHVTRLMTRESTASLRIMPARRNQR
ncbi:hypothetical protein F7725_011521 [Dissostichus mawsoni]|uniref:PDZ domain-containing protein n=1 Tax=Dissostichus mawsoni TaxID=36200 RepID=A0A7J5Z9P6_DISMA|nr:hypothetical protein F7725_011521 [Dissostichus mawsoni]